MEWPYALSPILTLTVCAFNGRLLGFEGSMVILWIPLRHVLGDGAGYRQEYPGILEAIPRSQTCLKRATPSITFASPVHHVPFNTK